VKIYQAGKQWIIGVEGGVFAEFKEEPNAIILDEQPKPGKMWQTPVEVEENPFKRERWEYLYRFQEFLSGSRKIYILKVEAIRTYPGIMSRVMDFFVSKQYVDKKIESFALKGNIVVHDWSNSKQQWIEIGRINHEGKEG
jgi:hypothetical protein